MRTLALRISLLVVAFCGSLCARNSTGSAAEPTKFDPKYLSTPNETATFKEMDGSCYFCHKTPRNSQPNPPRKDALERITFQETNRWRDADFHDQAGLALTKPRAKAMGELLGYDVTKNTQCLSCHTGHQKIVAKPGAPPQLTAPSDKMVLEHGVSCQACHGPASNWESPHRDADWWKKSSKEKYATGLLDVRHPTTRAQVCLSCHLGSSAEGKIITHEMYAAGHPPLGNFEIENFIDSMPFHGLLIEDKVKRTPDAHKDWYRKEDFYRTRSALTASLVALRMQVQLLLDETNWTLAAAPSAKPADGKSPEAYQPHWPELAHFNCASCHHELATDRLPPDRSASATPGRPMLRSWPTALYEVALRGSGVDPQAEPLLKPLEAALARNPFGRAKEVHDAAEKVAAQLDRELAAFESRTLDRAAALKYLEAISTVGQSRRVDYEEARQLAWAAKTIVKELKNSASGEEQTAAAAALVPAVAAFDADLRLGFAAKPPKEKPEDDDKVLYSPALLEAGSKSLNASVEFDESAFRSRLKILHETLQKTLQKALPPKS